MEILETHTQVLAGYGGVFEKNYATFVLRTNILICKFLKNGRSGNKRKIIFCGLTLH